MPANFEACLCEVRCRATSGYGTGYLIAPDLVLTACHVIAEGLTQPLPAKLDIDIRTIAHYKANRLFRGAKLVWPPPEQWSELAGLDIALLEIAPDLISGTAVPPIPLGTDGLPHDSELQISFTGFPRFMTMKDSENRDAKQMFGTAALAGGVKQDLIEITVRGRQAKSDDGWKGASGAAVFSQGRIIAVLNVKIVDGMVDFTAMRLDAALRDPSFRARVAASQATMPINPSVEPASPVFRSTKPMEHDFLSVQTLQHTLHIQNKKDPPRLVVDDNGHAFDKLLAAALDQAKSSGLPEDKSQHPFTYATNSLCRMRGRNVIWFRGPPGTGRSTFSQAAWKFLALHRVGQYEQPVAPFFFALNSHELTCAEKALELPLDQCVKLLLGAEIFEVKRFLEQFPDVKPIYIFDGFDQGNIFRRSFLRHYAKNLPRDGDATFLLTIDDDVAKGESVNEGDSLLLQQLALDAPSVVFQLRSSHINSPRAQRLIEAFDGAVKYESGAQTFDLRQKLNALDFTHVDLFSLSVVRSQAESSLYRAAKNYTDFYIQLFRSRLAQVARTTGSVETGDMSTLAKQLERKACEAAFGAVTTREAPAFIDIDSLAETGGAKIRAGVVEWSALDNAVLSKHHVAAAFSAFGSIQSHNLMQNSLAARHVYNGFVEIGGMSVKIEIRRASEALDFVFPANINRSFRHLLAGSDANERQAFKGAKAVAREAHAPFNARSHAVYLMGRMRSPSLRQQAKIELKKLLEHEKTRASKDVKTPSGPIEQDPRGAKLFRRGLFISLAYLGDFGAAKEYVTLILQNAEENKLNRGFHLEYYGDLEYTPVSGLAHEDPEDHRFRKTFHELSRRLETKVGRITSAAGEALPLEDASTPIEVATITSIIQTRHAKKLLNSELLNTSRTLLDDLLRLDLAEIPRLRSYVASIRRNLEDEDFAQADILSYWYRLKDEVRAGWLKRRRANQFGGDDRIESVAEHVLFAYLLALIFLPPWNPSLGDEYDKEKIKKILLVHDLAESFTGDHTPGDGHDESKELEWFNYMSSLDTYGDVWGTGEIFSLYEEFYQQRSHDARIAKDMDRLENLVQLYRYKSRLSESEFSSWEVDLTARIRTKPGQHVLKVLRVLKGRMPIPSEAFMKLTEF
jgi:5'-deoxynucleotidase YfbR-like HD superfamily hydrolase